MRKVIVFIVTFCFLFTNSSLSSATSNQVGDSEVVAPVELEGVDETDVDEDSSQEIESIDEANSITSIEQPDVISEIITDLSVNSSVYGEKPRGKFLIRVNPNVGLNVEPYNRGYSLSSLATSVGNVDLEQVAELYKVKSIDQLNTISMELNVDEVNQLLAHPLVESIEEDKPIEISESVTTVNPQVIKSTSQSIPWGIHSTGSYLAHSTGTVDLSLIKVAVFDTGISEHQDLHVSGGVSYVDNTLNYWDDHGHGTHIAGTIAALNNDKGVVGAAAGVQLYSVKVMDDTGYGYTSSVLQGIQWAIDNQIDIINMSFTATQYSEALHSAIQLAHEAGIIVIAAAGNQGLGENTIKYPALYPEVISVGAIDSSYHRASFSSTGLDLDFVAPGYGILSTTVDGGYGVTSGTSSAAAHVTAAAAWLWASNSSMSAEDVQQLLKLTATPLGDKIEYGDGLVNIAKALNIISGSIAPLSEENLSGTIPPPPQSVEGDIAIASYDKVNDGATVEVGSSVTVSLKLQGDQYGNNPHTKIEVEVYSPLNPSYSVESHTIDSPQLHQTIPYTWNVPVNLPTGTYHIRYHYPDTSGFDDTFVIYVIQSGLGPDTYEPNDTYINAKLVYPENSYISYISSSSDIDKYQFVADQSGKISIDLLIPANVDYELSVKNASGIIIAESSLGIGVAEHLSVQVLKDQLYYIEVIGFSGAFSTSPYTLSLGEIELLPFPAPTGLEAISFSSSIKLTWEAPVGAISYRLKLNGSIVGDSVSTDFTYNNLNLLSNYTLGVAAIYPEGISEYTEIQVSTAIPELIVYQPVDIDAAAGAYQLFSFKPASTGLYRIFTGFHSGGGNAVDTELGIYSNQQLTKLIDSNDDANNSVFSEIEVSLVGGQTYFVKVSGYELSRLQTRISAEVVSSSLPYVQLNQAVDINQQAGDSNVYIFVPSENGQFRIVTSPYNGISNSKHNDTELTVFSNLEMATPITNGYNDDKGLSVYSEVVVNLTAGTPYYVRVTAATGSKVYARLLVTKVADTDFTALTAGTAVNIQKSKGEEAYYKFTPTRGGVYRFFTSAPLGNAQVTDTEISIYSDVRLSNLIDRNDDVRGYRPYGELFSKLEVYLTAGTTYYLVVNSSSDSGLYVRFAVEDTVQSSTQDARDISWGESYEFDLFGQALQISSLYDADYYRVQLDNTEQVSIYVSNGEGAILDSNGNIRGYFGQEGRMNFVLPSGVFYLRVEHSAIHSANGIKSWNVSAYNYELLTYINEIYYTPGTYGETAALRMLAYEEPKAFDATPRSGASVSFKYKAAKSGDKLRVRVFSSNRQLVNERTITRSFSAGEEINIEWNGRIERGLVYDINLYAHSAFIVEENGMHYWAKSGSYEIVVDRIVGNSPKNPVSVMVTVFNDPLNSLNLVPLPPKYNDQKKLITASDIYKCENCTNYYNRYVFTPDSAGGNPQTGYEDWFVDMYGATGLKKFWQFADMLVTNCNGITNKLDALQCTIETIGMIPFLGEAADGINGVIYLVRGDYANALLASASMVPIVGAGFVGAKKFYKIYKHNPCGCLPAGTIIKTKNGDKLIENIQVGDLVLAKNVDTNIQTYKPVEQLFEFDAELIYTLEVAGKKIRTTSNHPFWVKGKGWVAADELMVGDLLESEEMEFHVIEQITFDYDPTKVYNFTVEDYHTYYISELGYLTHNLIDACDLNKYKNVKITVTSKASQNSEILRAELVKHTKINPPSGWAAHHIVAASHKNPDADAARNILRRNGIDKNSSANGVFLPPDKGKPTTQIDENTIVATHNGGHSPSYFEYVYNALSEAEALGVDGPDKQQKVLAALNQIREELLTGHLPIGNI